MEQPKRRCSGQEMNKMTVKMGGGGIGAVILMGGALATAALASAFLVRKRGRSSAENRRHLRRNTPPTATNELKNCDEQVEAKTGLQHVVLLETPSRVEKHTSVTRREVWESDSEAACLVSTQILKRDEESTGIEINGGSVVCVSDREETEKILSSINGKCTENEAISEGLVISKQVILPLGENLKFEPENMTHGVEIELTKEYDRFKQVPIEEKGFDTDGEEEEEKEIEKSKEDVAADGFELSGGNLVVQEKVIVVSSLSEGGQEALRYNEIEHEYVNGDERGVLPSEILEIIEEDKAVEGGPEVEIKHVEEKLAEEEEEFSQTHEEIVNVEETTVGDYDKKLIISTTAAMPKDELIDAANEEVVYQQKGQENDVEENIDDLILGKREAEDNITGSDEEDEDEQTDDSSSGTGDSSQESAEEHQQDKLEGNIQEDEAMETEKSEIQEAETATTNSTRWGILIGVLFILSSIFCSWFLRLSSIQFCFIMFLTMVLSKVSGSICTRDCSCKWTIFEPSTKPAT